MRRSIVRCGPFGMQERTARRIVRVYPKGTRTKSDNFDPLPCWAAGAPDGSPQPAAVHGVSSRRWP